MSNGTDDLPLGWITTTLGDVFHWTSGGTPTSSNKRFYGGSVPWALSGDLKDDILTTVPNSITEEGLSHSSAKWVEPGSVLVAMYGATIGKLGIASTRLTTNQAIAFTNPAPINTKYLFYYLLSQRKALVSSGVGAAQYNISQTIVKAHPFVLAPLKEQYRIVAEIEKQFSRLDNAVAALKRVQANLKRYRVAVLRAACEGRLVPTEAELARKESRDYEPADTLLQRILCERRARWEAEQLAKLESQGRLPLNDTWKAKYQEPDSSDISGLPELPAGWCWTTLRNIAEIKGGITKGQKRRPGNVLRSVPYLRVANVQRGCIDLSEIKYIDSTEEVIDQLRLLVGDILFTEGGDRDKLGRGWVWAGQIQECIHQNHVFRARLYSQAIEPKYISWYGNVAGADYFFQQGRQTTNLASINMSKLGSLPIPLPPPAEQIRIIAEVERRSSIMDEVEATIAANLKRAERLRQAILQRAFSGKLVPQDPNDEPASVLLERIYEERANGSAPHRPIRPSKSAPVRISQPELPFS